MGAIFRLLIIGAIIWFIYSMIRRTLTSQQPTNTVTNAPLMHQCAQCRVHIPEGESTQSQGKFFCCEAHRDLYLQQKP